MHRKTDMKRMYTTGDVARMLGTTHNTVTRWCNEGLIGGFRLPHSKERRIPIADLRAFMWEHRIPLDLLEDEVHGMRRVHTRVACDGRLHFTLINGEDHRPFPGRLEDLSRGGARIVYEGPDDLSLPRGARRMHLKVADGPLGGMDIPAQLVHVTPRDTDFAVGVRFWHLSQNQENRIEAAVGDVPEMSDAAISALAELPLEMSDSP